MLISPTKKDLPGSSISSGLFLRLDRHGRISVLNGDIASVIPQSMAADESSLQRILSAAADDKGSAASSAFDGRISSHRFRFESHGKFHHYELHCFPERGNDTDQINCVLLERSQEEERGLEMESRIHEMDIVVQAVRTFAETKNLTDILKIILLAVTAGPGLGFNRSFILLADETGQFLHGCLATGPSSAEEAGIIWKNLEEKPLSFDEALRLYKAGGPHNDIHVNSLITTIKIPLADDSHLIAGIVKNRRPAIIGPDVLRARANDDLRQKFGVNYMAVVPLYSGESLQGVILADNLINGKEITSSDLKILEIFARYASDAIENSRLYQKLQKQIGLLQEANEKILKSRENLVRAEKLSSIARMASDMAHEIRNPLTIVGGYANSRLRKIAEADESRAVFKLISEQARRIEAVLDRFSSILSICEKNEEKIPLGELIQGALGILAHDKNPVQPSVVFVGEVGGKTVFIDRNLFHQALAVILKEAACIAAGEENVCLTVGQFDDRAKIFITGGDKCPEFAEKFYSSLSCGKSEKKYQDMAVAIEILQHYGGDIGIGSARIAHGRLYVEIPLCKEEK